MSKKIAIVANTGLGDGLWMMLLAHNFSKAGYATTLFNTYLCSLSSLFPKVPIQPYLKDPVQLLSFDQIVVQKYTPGFDRTHLASHITLIDHDDFDRSKNYVLNLRDLCEQRFGLKEAGTDLGLSIPTHWSYRSHPRRVLIHPSSANSWKNWPRDKFIRLAQRLQEKKYHPLIILPSDEAAEWKSHLQIAGLREPVTLDWHPLAQFIYESGYLIGNDASAGHLASSLHVPTLSIFDRTSRACFWRPGWGPGEVTLPYPFLISRFLRKALWKQCLPVHRVLHTFEKLAIR